MKSKNLILLSILVFTNLSIAQTDIIFYSGFERLIKLNDTGITWSGEYPSGNSQFCDNLTMKQDCNVGRDVTDYDPNDGHAGFSFTKLDAVGNPLEDQSVDYATTPWACVRDNVTGLVWEVKTTTAGIHHKDNTYQWGGLTALGHDHPDRQGTYFVPSWNELVEGSNNGTLCGFTNWRVPTVAELSSIVNKGTYNPSIDTNYFPNTPPSSWFWSSSPLPSYDRIAWFVNFNYGNISSNNRDLNSRVRLVRSGQ